MAKKDSKKGKKQSGFYRQRLRPNKTKAKKLLLMAKKTLNDKGKDKTKA